MIPKVGVIRAWRALRALGSRVATVVVAQALYRVAFVWRRALRRTTFVAVTGTHGKTTTKEMLGAILGAHAPTLRTAGNENTGLPLTRTILRVRPRHRFAVIEIGVGAPGEMRRLARLVRPDLAVVLTMLRTHVKAFGTIEAHAAEKAILLEEMRPGGTAVLNADDPRVAAMAASARGRVVRSGTASEFDVRAENATSAWPDRLEFDVRTLDGEACHVRTRLVGTHWCVSATAALAAARTLGIPLTQGAAALAGVEPFLCRMQPMLVPPGATVIRDEYDGSIDTFEAGLKVLAEARAERRVAVISDVSEYGSTMRRKRVAHLGREAARVAEVVVFVGEAAQYGRKGALAAGSAPELTYAFGDFGEAAEALRAMLRPGDLVYLKGRNSDNMARLFYALLGTTGGRRNDGNACPDPGGAPEGSADATPASVPRPAAPGSEGERP